MQSSNKVRRSYRGVKICPKCKTFNGNKSLYCKNPACFTILKRPVETSKNTTLLNNVIKSSKVNANIDFQDHTGSMQICSIMSCNYLNFRYCVFLFTVFELF